jgi:hypothetical protein
MTSAAVTVAALVLMANVPGRDHVTFSTPFIPASACPGIVHR